MINLHNLDCLPELRKMPDKAFELAIVDPPYAVGASDGSFGRGGHRAKNSYYRKELKHYADHNKVPGKDYFNELFRVSSNQIIWGANYYPEHLTHSGWIIWDKDKKDGLLSQAELAFQSINKITKIFRFEWEGFRRGVGSFESTLKKTIHPNQKPVALYEWLLNNYAKPGDRILDTHFGSLSIGIACFNLGFDLTAYEIDKDYFNAGKARLENHMKKGRLFETVNGKVVPTQKALP